MGMKQLNSYQFTKYGRRNKLDKRKNTKYPSRYRMTDAFTISLKVNKNETSLINSFAATGDNNRLLQTA